MASLIDANHFMLTTDDFRILEVFHSQARMKEHREWAIKHMGIDKLPYKGEGQRVGVIDTGCDANHQDLKGQVTAANFISGCKQMPASQDNNGHGTFCTGEIVAKEDGKGIVGAAPKATAFSARVLYGDSKDMRRSDVNKDLANAIRGCVADGCGVISMSLGGPGADPHTKDALDYAVSKGVIPIAAAGNERLEGSPYASYPAAYPTVISVAAANKVDLPTWFSTIGVGGTKAQQPEIAVSSLEYYYGCLPGVSTYGTMIGTSQATPMIAALALLWREAREKSTMPTGADVFKEFRTWLRKVANDTNKNGWDPELGFGVALIEPSEMP